MTEKKCNLFRYIASGLLILHVVAIIISGNFSVSNLLAILADVILSVSLLTKKDKFFSVGIVIRLIHTIVVVFNYIGFMSDAGVDIGLIWYYLQTTNLTATFLMKIVSIVPYVLIVIYLFDVKKHNKLGIVSVGLLFATDIVAEVFTSGFIGILSGLIIAITSSLPIVFAVIAIQNSPQSKPIVIKKRTTPNITTGEKLTKLKELLDMGAITQEEFDAKKKQLLGL